MARETSFSKEELEAIQDSVVSKNSGMGMTQVLLDLARQMFPDVAMLVVRFVVTGSKKLRTDAEVKLDILNDELEKPDISEEKRKNLSFLLSLQKSEGMDDAAFIGQLQRSLAEYYSIEDKAESKKSTEVFFKRLITSVLEKELALTPVQMPDLDQFLENHNQANIGLVQFLLPESLRSGEGENFIGEAGREPHVYFLDTGSLVSKFVVEDKKLRLQCRSDFQIKMRFDERDIVVDLPILFDYEVRNGKYHLVKLQCENGPLKNLLFRDPPASDAKCRLMLFKNIKDNIPSSLSGQIDLRALGRALFVPYLRDADLTDADLTKATLTGMTLSNRTRLSGASVSDIVIDKNKPIHYKIMDDTGVELADIKFMPDDALLEALKQRYLAICKRQPNRGKRNKVKAIFDEKKSAGEKLWMLLQHIEKNPEARLASAFNALCYAQYKKQLMDQVSVSVMDDRSEAPNEAVRDTPAVIPMTQENHHRANLPKSDIEKLRRLGAHLHKVHIDPVLELMEARAVAATLPDAEKDIVITGATVNDSVLAAYAAKPYFVCDTKTALKFQKRDAQGVLIAVLMVKPNMLWAEIEKEQKAQKAMVFPHEFGRPDHVAAIQGGALSRRNASEKLARTCAMAIGSQALAENRVAKQLLNQAYYHLYVRQCRMSPSFEQDKKSLIDSMLDLSRATGACIGNETFRIIKAHNKSVTKREDQYKTDQVSITGAQFAMLVAEGYRDFSGFSIVGEIPKVALKATSLNRIKLDGCDLTEARFTDFSTFYAIESMKDAKLNRRTVVSLAASGDVHMTRKKDGSVIPTGGRADLLKEANLSDINLRGLKLKAKWVADAKLDKTDVTQYTEQENKEPKRALWFAEKEVVQETAEAKATTMRMPVTVYNSIQLARSEEDAPLIANLGADKRAAAWFESESKKFDAEKVTVLDFSSPESGSHAPEKRVIGCDFEKDTAAFKLQTATDLCAALGAGKEIVIVYAASANTEIKSQSNLISVLESKIAALKKDKKSSTVKALKPLVQFTQLCKWIAVQDREKLANMAPDDLRKLMERARTSHTFHFFGARPDGPLADVPSVMMQAFLKEHKTAYEKQKQITSTP